MAGAVTIQDPTHLDRQIAVNADGSINVTAAGGGDAVTIADGADVTQGAVADAAYVSGSGTVVSVLKGIFGKLAAAIHVIVDSGTLTTLTTITNPAGIKGADGTSIVSITNTLPTQPISVNGTLQETTITLGGTAQSLFSAATPTNGYEIVNPPSATETLYFREANTAAVAGAASVPIVVGGSYVTPAGYKPTGLVSVIAATTSHPVIARRW